MEIEKQEYHKRIGNYYLISEIKSPLNGNINIEDF